MWDNPKEPGAQRRGHGVQPREDGAVRAGRRGALLRAAHRRPASRRAARLLHAVRFPVGIPRPVSDSDHPDAAVPGDVHRVHERHAHHSARRTSAQDRHRADVLRRAGRPLGRRHAGDRGEATTSAGRWTIGTTRTRRNTGCTPRRCAPIERLRRVDADTIAYEFTVDDPKIFTKPWSVAMGDEAPPRVGQDRASTRWSATRTTAAKAASAARRSKPYAVG